ncbi:MAG TPA: HAD family hydrolase [Bryobacteraceae bacterium]
MQRRFAGCVEIVRRPGSQVQPRVAFFDFDGTVGLIRAGWMQLMIRQALEELRATGTTETDAELLAVVEEFIFRLTGKPTICQMMELADNVRKRGGVPIDPVENKNRFLAQLQEQSERRMKAIRGGDVAPDRFMVPGTREVLGDLRRRGLRLYLVSGTDDALVQEEAQLFNIVHYFDGGVYGSPGDHSDFSKLGLAKEVVARGEASGADIVSFGDGPVELEAIQHVGGVAVGLATLEPECDRIDPWKRQRLISTGAHYIIPNFLCWNELKEQLFAE